MDHGSNRVDRMVELEIKDRLAVLLQVNLDSRVLAIAIMEIAMVQIVTS